MTQDQINIHKNFFRSDGRYIGFIKNDLIYSRDGIYIGWMDGKLAWDTKGIFKGVLTEYNGVYYILKDKYTASPTARSPRTGTNIQPLNPPANIPPISLPTGIEDGFLNEK